MQNRSPQFDHLKSDYFTRDVSENANEMARRLDSIRDTAPIAGRTPIENEHVQHQWENSQLIPEIDSEDFSTETLRSAIASKGLLIVRNFLSKPSCANYRDIIDKVLLLADPKRPPNQQGLEHFCNIAPNIDSLFPEKDLMASRGFQRSTGSAMVMESSSTALELLALYQSTGLKEILKEYLGQAPCLSVKKWMLRRSVLPVHPDGWHQDGAFMGSDINSLNMWLPLSRCGGDTGAPGLDIVPYRFTHTVPTGTEGAAFKWSIAPDIKALNMPDHMPVSPEFNAGDALFFDHFSLHRTQYKPESFTDVRYAIETWFFSESNFPKAQIPVAW